MASQNQTLIRKFLWCVFIGILLTGLMTGPATGNGKIPQAFDKPILSMVRNFEKHLDKGTKMKGAPANLGYSAKCPHSFSGQLLNAYLLAASNRDKNGTKKTLAQIASHLACISQNQYRQVHQAILLSLVPEKSISTAHVDNEFWEVVAPLLFIIFEMGDNQFRNDYYPLLMLHYVNWKLAFENPNSIASAIGLYIHTDHGLKELSKDEIHVVFRSLLTQNSWASGLCKAQDIVGVKSNNNILIQHRSYLCPKDCGLELLDIGEETGLGLGYLKTSEFRNMCNKRDEAMSHLSAPTQEGITQCMQDFSDKYPPYLTCMADKFMNSEREIGSVLVEPKKEIFIGRQCVVSQTRNPLSEQQRREITEAIEVFEELARDHERRAVEASRRATEQEAFIRERERDFDFVYPGCSLDLACRTNEERIRRELKKAALERDRAIREKQAHVDAARIHREAVERWEAELRRGGGKPKKDCSPINDDCSDACNPLEAMMQDHAQCVSAQNPPPEIPDPQPEVTRPHPDDPGQLAENIQELLRCVKNAVNTHSPKTQNDCDAVINCGRHQSSPFDTFRNECKDVCYPEFVSENEESRIKNFCEHLVQCQGEGGFTGKGCGCHFQEDGTIITAPISPKLPISGRPTVTISDSIYLQDLFEERP